MRHKLIAAAHLAPIAMLGLAVSLVHADPIDPVVEKIIAQGRTMIEAGDSAYLDLEIEAWVAGEVQLRMSQDVWIGNRERIRVDINRESVICVTPEEALLHETDANVCLWLPPETLEALGDNARAAAAEFTFGTDMMTLWSMWDAGEFMEVVGEDTVDGAECWVIGLSGKLFDAWSGIRGQVGDGFTVDSVQFHVDKEQATPRRLSISMSGPFDVSLVISILTMEVGADIPDERFEYEVPEDALVVKWDPEQEPAGNMAAFRSAVATAKQARQQ